MKITKRQLRRIIREALDPRLAYQDPEAYWKKPRRGSVERSKIIHDKLTKGDDLSGPGKMAWVHGTGKDDDLDEAEGYTKKHDEDKHLTPLQGKKLPDAVQKGIIDKAEGEESKEEKNESMRIYLKKTIRETIQSTSISENTHRCMDGTMVDDSSPACYDDILNRIDDAQFNRDHHSCGTENRVYYNGLLKGLRNKRNRLQKRLQV